MISSQSCKQAKDWGKCEFLHRPWELGRSRFARKDMSTGGEFSARTWLGVVAVAMVEMRTCKWGASTRQVSLQGRARGRERCTPQSGHLSLPSTRVKSKSADEWTYVIGAPTGRPGQMRGDRARARRARCHAHGHGVGHRMAKKYLSCGLGCRLPAIGKTVVVYNTTSKYY